MLRSILASTFAATLALTGCSKSGSTCDKAVDNTLRILAKDMPDAAKGADRKDLLAKCAKQPAKAQQCAADAKDMEALMACGRGE